jgi:iron complex outermembrane recepter protein
VAKDNWTAQLSGSNIGNSDAVTNITSGQFIKAQIPLRPRVLLFQLGYRF